MAAEEGCCCGDTSTPARSCKAVAADADDAPEEGPAPLDEGGDECAAPDGDCKTTPVTARTASAAPDDDEEDDVDDDDEDEDEDEDEDDDSILSNAEPDRIVNGNVYDVVEVGVAVSGCEATPPIIGSPVGNKNGSVSVSEVAREPLTLKVVALMEGCCGSASRVCSISTSVRAFLR